MLTRWCQDSMILLYLYDQVEALCVIWASGQVNADLQAIEKALQASGSKVKTKQMLTPRG